MSEVLKGEGMTTQQHTDLKECLNRIGAALENITGFICAGVTVLSLIAAANVSQCAAG